MTKKEIIKQKQEEIASLKEENENHHQSIDSNEKHIFTLEEELYKLEAEIFDPIGKCYKYVNTHYCNNNEAKVIYVHVIDKSNIACIPILNCSQLCPSEYNSISCGWACEEITYGYIDKKLRNFSYEYKTDKVIYPNLKSPICHGSEKLTEVSVDEFEHVKSYFMSGNPPRSIDDIIL